VCESAYTRMVLSDKDIKYEVINGGLMIEPYAEKHVEPASMDLRLGESFKKSNGISNTESGEFVQPVSLSSNTDCIDWKSTNNDVLLQPGDFVLASTKEYIEIPDYLVGQVEGRSSIGRMGISIHQTAGYIDPGFNGNITLELTNHGPVEVLLSRGDRVCQIVFNRLSQPAEDPYGHEDSQYQNQSGPETSGMSF